MSKNCKSCGFLTQDADVFCPACGSVFENGTQAQATSEDDGVTVIPPRANAQPVKSAVPRNYAQPIQAAAKQQPAPARTGPAAEKPKKRLPYILLGVGMAAVVFVIALIIVLSTGSKLAGTYTWTNGPNGATGSLVIKNDHTGVFTYYGSGTVDLTFDTEKKTASFTGSDGKLNVGTYTLNDDLLSITTDGYTDTFRKQ